MLLARVVDVLWVSAGIDHGGQRPNQIAAVPKHDQSAKEIARTGSKRESLSLFRLLLARRDHEQDQKQNY
jgi:hypothetical protein